MRGNVFISYRRDDAAGMAGRLYDRLIRSIPKKSVFMDVDAMKPGLDFVQQLDKHVADCSIVLALIGPNWTTAADEEGKRRLDNPNDYVRLEIASALRRAIPVVPVLLDGATVPREADLPADLKLLARRHAVELRHTRFGTDIDLILDAIRDVQPGQGRRAWIIAAAAVLLVIGLGAYWWLGLQPSATREVSSIVPPTPAEQQASLAREAEAARKAEEERQREDAKRLEEQRRAEEAKRAEDARKAEEAERRAKQAAAAAEEQRLVALKEIALWDTIKDSNNPALFDAYLKRYPSGQFAGPARSRIKELETAASAPAAFQPGDDQLVSGRDLVREAQERLYELNYNPGPQDGTISAATEQALREFEARLGVPQTGRLTQGLMRRLRAVGGLKPWGAIVFADSSQKWGMSWDHRTRKEAVTAAQASCGPSPSSCSIALTFFGTECGAFAYSDTRWSLIARDTTPKARLAALEECQKQGARCKVVASVCADGQEKSVSP
jgi:peptidoglycan hydrolase-like protein with peptidoglycan-binding domain